MENPNRNFKSQTCEDFIEVLASKAAVPGGGGASALAGAIGIALGNMVGSLTVGKKTYADVEEEIIECKKKADEIAKEFLELMDKDAEAFEPLSKAYGLPKSTPEEIAKKAGMGYSLFRKLFKEQKNYAPVQYFQNLKIQKAIELLTTTTIPVKEIAYRLDFESPAYFSARFKKQTGKSPDRKSVV